MCTIKLENYNDNKKKINQILIDHQNEHGQEIYKRKEEISLALYNKDTYAGGLVATLTDHNIHIERLGITKECRNLGYGTKLINALLVFAKRNDCHTITVTTLNFQGKNFYLKNGFTLFGEIQNVPKLGNSKYYFILNT